LLEDFKKGSGNQFEKIAVIRAKIIFYSLAIQVMVQKVVDKEKLILTNGANEPIVENACCNADGSVNTIKYFVEQERIIDDYNKQVTLLRNVLDDIIEIQKSSSFYDPENTRTKYPDIPEGFDEQTIYMAFIVYCKFNSDVPIPNSIQHLCHDKPSTENYNPSEESLKVKIDKLKSTGEYTYTPEALQALLQIVNGEHTISFDFNPTEVSYIQRMRDLIKSYQEKHSSEVPEILLTKLTELLDTFNIQISEDTPELRELKNYLSEKNGEMVDAILEFISQYKSLDRKTTKLYKSFLLNITNFKLIGDNVLCPKRDTSTYKGMQFVVNEMRNLIHVFPNIILNGVNNQKVSVHKHWGLSRQHVLDIQTIVKKYYTEIDKYMKDKENSVLATVVTGVMKETNEWFQFALNTPLFARVIKRDVSKVQGQGDVMEMDVEEFEEEEMAEEGDAGGLLSGLFGKAASSRGVPSRREESRKEEREESEAETRGSARQYRKRTSEEDSGGMYSLFNDDLVRRLFTHYFLNVVLKYVKLARTVVVVAQEAQLQEEDESSLVSVLEAQDQQNGVVREVSFVAQEDAELKNMVANLLLVFFKIIMADKTAINVNNKSIKEDITQSKDKEKDIITREFRDMQVAERQVENLMKNLRLGDWNVGATKGLRFYVPETYEQEREQMENEFRRDEEQAKMEKKALKRDKVTVRMRDIYADEEEERLHQDAEIEADLADEYNLQGDDDEYGVEDDGAYNPRDGGEGDD
jgi:ribosome recycling factor